MSDQNPPAGPLDSAQEGVPAPIEQEIEETAAAQIMQAEQAEHSTVGYGLYEEEFQALEHQVPLGYSKYQYERRQRAQWLKEAKDLHGLRQTYTSLLFKLTCAWLSAVLLFVFMSGFHGPLPLFRRYLYWNDSNCDPCIKWAFALSDKVLIAFITSTTASVIGIFIIVAKWLFPSDYKPDKSKEKSE